MTTLSSTCTPKSPSSVRSHATSHAATAAPLYLAFVLNKATVGYFLLLQVTAALPKENVKPLVERLSPTLPAQSASV